MIALPKATWRLLAVIAGLMAVRLAVYAIVAGSAAHLPANLCQWDCGWYVHLAAEGYDTAPKTLRDIHGQSNWAFFPMFPLLIRCCAAMLRLSYPAAGFLVANLSLAGFVFLAANYLAGVRRNISPILLVMFLLAFPYSVYFSFAYTESLYALLAMAVFCLLASNRRVAASLAAAALSATRVTGVLLAPVVALHALQPAWRAWRCHGARAAMAHAADALLPIALAPFGLFAFIGFLQLHMGDGLAFVHIQAGWGRHQQNPLILLYTHLLDYDPTQMIDKKTQSTTISEYSAIAGLAMGARLFCIRRPAEGWFLMMSVLLAASAGLISMQRYVLANPIFMIYLFELICRGPLRRCFALVLLACAATQVFLLHTWVLGYASLM